MFCYRKLFHSVMQQIFIEFCYGPTTVPDGNDKLIVSTGFLIYIPSASTGFESMLAYWLWGWTVWLDWARQTPAKLMFIEDF